MNPSLQAARWILLLLLGAHNWRPIAAQVAAPATRPAELTLEEIVNNLVQRNAERAETLAAFRGTRVYRLEYSGFPNSRSAEMVVDVKYQSPATKVFTIRSSTGSKLIIEKVFNKLLQSEKDSIAPENQNRIALNKVNYSFGLVARERTLAGSCYVLSVEPRTTNKLLYRGRIWVDATDFAVTRIEATPAKSPSFWIKDTNIEHVYMKVGDFWLPSSNYTISNTRLGGRALLTINYITYELTPALARSKETLAGH